MRLMSDGDCSASTIADCDRPARWAASMVISASAERKPRPLYVPRESVRRRSDVDTWVWIVIIVAIVVIVGAALSAFAISMLQKRRDETLRSQFGPEYDRTMKQMGSRKKAEKALLGRKE